MCRLEITLLFLASLVTISLQAISTRVEEIKLVYPARVRSERDLSICEGREICSVIHRRFWLRPTVQRLCRCPTGHECPWSWGSDNQTMPLNNRSQIKFCESIADLDECTTKQPAINVTLRTETVRVASSRNKTEKYLHKLVTAECRCQERHYWKYYKDTEADYKNGTSAVTQLYRCSKLRKCAPDEFCGNIRADHFSAYYRCSCPTGHMCLFRNRATTNVTELFYEGLAHEAFCTRQ